MVGHCWCCESHCDADHCTRNCREWMVGRCCCLCAGECCVVRVVFVHCGVVIPVVVADCWSSSEVGIHCAVADKCHIVAAEWWPLRWNELESRCECWTALTDCGTF